MTVTGGDIVSGALKLLGVLAAGETATADDAQDSLKRLNSMIDAWGLQRLSMYHLLRTVKTLSSSTASYTIGTGGDINIVRPTFVEHAGLILDSSASPTVEAPVEILTNQRWADIRIKSQSGSYVQAIWYDHGWTSGLGRIYVYPVPNVANTQLVLYTPVAVTQFANLTTSYTLPPGYEEAFRYNLAVRLAPEFGRRLDPDGVIISTARDTKADVMQANMRPTELAVDPAISADAGGTWDWRTGGFR